MESAKESGHTFRKVWAKVEKAKILKFDIPLVNLYTLYTNVDNRNE